MKILAMTMVYNESINLPLWLKHYGRELGEQSCLVLDHGSTDGSTNNIGKASKIVFTRQEPIYEGSRMMLVNDITRMLFVNNGIDAILYTDCDEMLVADPKEYLSLRDYINGMRLPVAHTVGTNIRQDITQEVSLNYENNILFQ